MIAFLPGLEPKSVLSTTYSTPMVLSPDDEEMK